MSKRRSEEARVLAYFTQAPLEKAELMFGLVRDHMKQRAPRAVTRQSKKAAAKKGNAAGTQTVFDPIQDSGGAFGAGDGKQ